LFEYQLHSFGTERDQQFYHVGATVATLVRWHGNTGTEDLAESKAHESRLLAYMGVLGKLESLARVKGVDVSRKDGDGLHSAPN